MNKVNQIQLTNVLPRPNMKDSAPQPLVSQPNQPNSVPNIDRSNRQSEPSTNTNRANPALQAGIHEIPTSKKPPQGRQGAQAEETRLDVNHQPVDNFLQVSNELEIPPPRNPPLKPVNVDLARLAKMTVEEVKTSYFNGRLECLLCSTSISQKFKWHFQICAQKRMTSSVISQANAQPIRALNHPVSRVAKQDGDEIIKKLKGEVATLTRKVNQLSDGDRETKKEVKAIQKTQGSMEKRMTKNEAQVGELVKDNRSLMKSVETNQKVLMKLYQDNEKMKKESMKITSTCQERGTNVQSNKKDNRAKAME